MSLVPISLKKTLISTPTNISQKKSLKVHPFVVYIFQGFFKQLKQFAENFSMKI